MSFLFYQAQRVDTLNREHSQVLDLLHQAGRLNDQLRQGVMQVYYERDHNFDTLLDLHRGLEQSIRSLQSSPYASFREASTGVEYYMRRLANMQAERGELVTRFMKSVVLLKNAITGLSRHAELDQLAQRDSQLYKLLNDYRNTLLAFASNPTPSLSEQAEQMLEELDAVLLELEDSGSDEHVNDALQFTYQHGQVVFRERVQVEKLINQLYQIPLGKVLNQVTEAYLNYHEQQERLSGYYRSGLFAAGAMLLIFLVATLLRLRFTASHLLGEKEMAQITLGSIGDGVITTDRQGMITFMNPVAERLLGYQFAEVRNAPLTQVLQLFSEITNKPIDDPATRAIEQEKVIEITQHVYMVRADGSRNHLSLTVSPIGQLGKDVLGAVLVFQDVDESRVLAEQLHYETSHDALTGLYNRMTFAQKIQQHLGESDGKRSPILWHIDLDHFSVINDICGSKGGDGFLRQVAGELKRALGEHDVLSRVGGDEFAVLRPNAEPSDALNVACELREVINGIRFEWEDNSFDTTATIGVVFINQNYRDLSDVFMAANSAVDSAREQGRNNIHIHTKDIFESSRKHELSLWVPKIKKALDEQRYRLYLQSISPITQHGCEPPHHVEVLLRMETEDGRILPPIFIPAAEEYNLMPQLDRWVISEVCANIAQAREQGTLAAQFSYSVNLSGTTLSDTFFLDFIRNLFDEHAIEPTQICFEITETAAIQNLESAIAFIEAVRQMGCQFALDDFGSGMSSFAYLKNLPVDYLKIDGAFVKQLAKDPVQYSIVEAVNKVGRTLGMKTIAEFVEDDEIIRGLSTIGVDFAQGYGIDQPRPWTTYFIAQEERQSTRA
nr:EAL domain-containing protein [Motiliproteus sediminis]